jgi:transposase
VDDWLAVRVAALKVQADERGAGQLRECGVALRAMKERGESVRDIARMAGISEKTARVLIRCGAAERRRGAAARAGIGHPARAFGGLE